MVGVPGRSKSCGTCRIRKKGGCDQKRPACGQCLRLGLKCEGYQRETRFINFSVEPCKPRRSVQPSAQVILPAALARSAYAENYFGTFWSAYLPKGKQFPAHIMQYASGGWTNTLPQLYHTSPAIKKIMLAVCLSTAGQAKNSRWEIEEGIKYYMGSLAEMSSALANRTKENITTLCVISRLYSLYEVPKSQTLVFIR
ncbi:predicted protein [Uncinocarpus reesii 1704]|uniref:Zn(2)-C6 fungal-type domain-containing protein n=1 Tax=Uncinocarpus reesii (strain UAMH 1704) TaxID=336963 RepID=C4JK07_UNCRE|nr:uncharacterized protein UREG_01964 [Uncinocarpus reesii 1704]EEP77115.1 predicted protein [Uncinocarpus reesii 1704]